MTPLVLSTGTLAAKDQFAAWCSWFGPVFDIELTGNEASGFLADCTTWQLGSALLCRVAAPALKVRRGPGLIRRDHMDHWNIAFGTGGAATGLEAGPESCTVPTGVPFVLSLGRAVSSDRAADERLQLYFSRDQFPHLNLALDAVSGRPLHSPLGKLLAEFLLLLERNLPEIGAESLPGLADGLRAMVATCVGPTPDRMAEAGKLVQLTQMERIRTVVRQHMASPRLGPALLCREVGMSRSKLYRVLESEGGVVHYIQQYRLQESFAKLSDPAVTSTIAAIAIAHGFPDSSAFSRAFRHAFGLTPSEVREAARFGVLMMPQAKPTVIGDMLTLKDCLRSL